MNDKRISKLIKSMMDFVMAALLIIITSPLLLIIGLFIKVKLKVPAIFRQTRPGLHGKPFLIYKFQTMLETKDDAGNLLADEERLTPFGKFLRSTSLDELPELFNVVRGEMSFVGPRPLLMEYLERYTSEQARRHTVKPGITGWAQVNGRNALSWEERFNLDVWYVDHWSIWLDLKTMWLTVMKVIKREGISAAGHATMPKYQGVQTDHQE